MSKEKRSFFERLTGSVPDDIDFESDSKDSSPINASYSYNSDGEESEEDGQLAVDVFQSDNEIIIRAIVAGLRPEDVDVFTTRDSVTIRGKRDGRRTGRENYFCQELYWGPFSRTISLSGEIDPDSVDAVTKNGVLTIKLPLINKNRTQKIRVKEE